MRLSYAMVRAKIKKPKQWQNPNTLGNSYQQQTSWILFGGGGDGCGGGGVGSPLNVFWTVVVVT